VSFSDNRASNFQARELKTVQVDAVGDLLRVVLHKCYSNNLNIYGQVCCNWLSECALVSYRLTKARISNSHVQVGVVAFNVLGELPDQYLLRSLEESGSVCLS
jgi:hypothetical protein